MLDFGWNRRAPLILQTEAAECGLACVLMVAGHHGHRIDMPSARRAHGTSLKGATLTDLMRIAGKLDLAPRPLRVEPSHLADLQLPCVLHWDFNHFVVLTHVGARQVRLLDPARGAQTLTLQELSRHFTGVALELSPAPGFAPRREQRRVPLNQLIGRPPGLTGAMTQVLLLALVLQVFAIAVPFQIQLVVDQALVARDHDLVRVLGVGFVLLAVAQVGVTALRAWLLVVLGTVLKLQMMARLFRHLVRLPLDWFIKRHVGDVSSRFDSLEQIQNTLTTSAIEAVVDGVMALTTLGMMIAYSPRLTIVALTAAGLYALLRAVLYGPLRRASEQQIVCRARQHSHFLESVRGMQSIKLLAAEDQRTQVWHNRVVEQFNAGIRAQRLGLAAQAGNGLLFGVENAVTVWVGAGLVLDGSGLSVGMLLAFIAYKMQFVQRVAALVDKGLEFRMLGLHTERVGDVVLTTPEAQAGPEATSASAANVAAAPSLEVKDLSFRYGESEPLVIDRLNLRIEAGESVAIVGPSGCGKTTLAKLMLGVLQPTSGSIEFGGQPLARVGMALYRRATASVMQDDQLFAGSIADNIAFFDESVDHGRLAECARLAAVHDEILAMPMQYDTLVGEMGSVLSGGQKQRLLLARALYRQPRLLVLDEATSHLDIARERTVSEAIRALNLTRIIIAHRPETIASADRIVTLGADDGERNIRRASNG